MIKTAEIKSLLALVREACNSASQEGCESDLVILDADKVRALEEAGFRLRQSLEKAEKERHGDSHVRVTIDVEYTANGVAPESVIDNIENALMREISNGALTGSSDAEVENYRIVGENLLGD